MKVSKSLLQTIAVGLVVAGSLNSCSQSEDFTDLHYDTCTENCDYDHAKERVGEGEENTDWNCPACGMG